jgi:hypothetical protein
MTFMYLPPIVFYPLVGTVRLGVIVPFECGVGAMIQIQPEKTGFVSALRNESRPGLGREIVF